MTNTTKRAAIYARVSTKFNGQNPETQLIALREYVKSRGWTIACEYVDRVWMCWASQASMLFIGVIAPVAGLMSAFSGASDFSTWTCDTVTLELPLVTTPKTQSASGASPCRWIWICP